MTHPDFGASLADAHRRELVGEARDAARAAEAIPASGGAWFRVLLAAADLLQAAGLRLHARLYRQRRTRSFGVAAGDAGVTCPFASASGRACRLAHHAG